MTYVLQDPPLEIPLADLTQWSGSTLVDYENHPAYAPLSGMAPWRIVGRAWARFVWSYLIIKIKRLIRYEMIPLHVRQADSVSDWLRLFGFALRHSFQGSRPRALSLVEPSLTRLDFSFRRYGCAVLGMPEHASTALANLTQLHFDQLASRRGDQAGGGRDFEASRSYARRDRSAPLFEIVEKVLIDSGVMETASRYLQRQVRLIDVNPQINDPSDDFWRRVFPDLQVPMPSTAYFHRDASGGDIKVIIYMSDVGEENGPFTYVVGSHRMNLREVDDHIAEANDSNGMAGTGIYNRSCFMALPRRLRQKGAFGNDVDPKSNLSMTLLQSAWCITASKGSIVMFDTKGVHRGGMVLSGERRVITCVVG